MTFNLSLQLNSVGCFSNMRSRWSTRAFYRNFSFKLLLVALPTIVMSSILQAQQNVVSIADREAVRRQEDLIVADKLIIKGDKALKEKDYENAYLNYLDALEKIPASPTVEKKRAAILKKFSQTGIDYANFLVQNGRYSDAERVAKTILLPQFNPTYKPAVQFLSNLEQSDYYNKTVTPQFAAARDQVLKLLAEADGFYATGRYDLAIKRYEQVLNIDPYNNAARMGMERVNEQRSKYYDTSYNETRSRMLWLVDRAWERPIRKFQGQAEAGEAQNRNIGGSNVEAINTKLNRIIIPKIDLSDVTIREAVDWLKQRSRELDTTTEDPAQKRGVNIVLRLQNAPSPAAPETGEAGTPPAPTVTPDSKMPPLSLKNVPLMEAIRYLCELAGLKYKVEPFAVSIVPITENTDELFTKEYRVPPGFIPANTTANAEVAPVAGAGPNVTEARLAGRTDALEFLKSQGIPFPPSSFAQYVPAGSRLIVRNTQDALDVIDRLVEAARETQPTQVEVEAKFLEITQNNLKELGFDWLLGPFSMGNGVYGAGGTEGYGTNLNPTSPDPSTYPFVANGTPVGQDPVTAGLRSGKGLGPGAAVTANSLDALLAGTTTGITAAPGIFGLAGIFTNPQFQVVIRALNQKKGIDLMSAPKTLVKSGNRAVIKVVRNFPYPTEFNPPEPPPGTTVTGTIVLPPGSLQAAGIVTPSTPTTFETRDVGVTLDVTPQIGPDNYTVDMSIIPEVVEFDGFVNYGSPIYGATFNFTTLTVNSNILTQNVINQPIFSSRKVTTEVSVWDGATVALGGLIREDVQKVEDKIPIIGDIPLAGRLFRSNVDEKIKRNMIIFVTARIMDAEGRPIRREEEQEEVVEPLGLPPDLPRPTFETARSLGK